MKPEPKNDSSEIKRYSLDDVMPSNSEPENVSSDSAIDTASAVDSMERDLPKREIDEEEQLRKSQDRIMKLKALSLKIKSPGGINDLEKEPAYKRRNIKLDDTPHSSESNVSRYTLGEDEDNKTSLKQNNSFLHDNVD